MDKKKLIGTIIGVVMFGLLIAGATYAWLTISATVTDGNYDTGTRNFTIAYDNNNSSISALPILTITSASEVASSTASTVTLTAALNNEDDLKGDLKLTLVTSSDDGNLVTSGAMRYAVSINDGTPTEPQTVTSTEQVLVLSGTNTTTELIDSTTADTIKVYMWLDGSSLQTSGVTYSGYIKASATQRED